MTHNFRPIQPLGDRVVFYVLPTSADDVFDTYLDNDIPAMTEPSQNIDFNTQINHDKFQGNEQNEFPDDMENIEKNVNSLDTDTTSHPKNTRKHKNTGSITSISTLALIMSACVSFALNCGQ